MRKLSFAAAVALAVTIAAPARAADLPLKTETPFAARFTWTGCYLGGHLGGGFSRKDITDPVQLVQDSLLGPGSTTGITTVSPAPSGVVIGGQTMVDAKAGVFMPPQRRNLVSDASGVGERVRLRGHVLASGTAVLASLSVLSAFRALRSCFFRDLAAATSSIVRTTAGASTPNRPPQQ